MEPIIRDFAATYVDVEFIKIDVDELDVCSFDSLAFLWVLLHWIILLDSIAWYTDFFFLQDVAREYGVQAMPTFILMKKGKEIDKFVGAKKDELQKKIEKHIV